MYIHQYKLRHARINRVLILIYFQSDSDDNGLCEYEKRFKNIAELESFRRELNLKSLEEEFSLCEVSNHYFL